jgi:hypothetical protein
MLSFKASPSVCGKKTSKEEALARREILVVPSRSALEPSGIRYRASPYQIVGQTIVSLIILRDVLSLRLVGNRATGASS